MRLYGYVTVDGVRVPLDWSVNGVTVESVGGLSADEVFVKVDLPKYVDDEGELLEEAVSEEVEDDFDESEIDDPSVYEENVE